MLVFAVAAILGIAAAFISTAQLVSIQLIPADTNGFPAFYIIGATQQASNTCIIQASRTLDFASPVNFAVWDCYPYEQNVSGSFPITYWPQTFFRSVNIPCP